MLGIEDPQIWAAYLLSILSALACIVYGIVNWNKGDEPIYPEDTQWVKDEKDIEANL